jgi:hypothetical protein
MGFQILTFDCVKKIKLKDPSQLFLALNPSKKGLA